MAITVLEKKVLSTDGIHELAGRVFLPDGEIRGIFHVVHGMTEYIGRYEAFMTKLAENGYLTFGYDHVGHGNTARTPEELGFIADKDGDKILYNDVKLFADAVRKEYGENLPYYLMGHSMGSFIVRLAVTETDLSPDRLIVMGTGGPNPAASIGIGLANLISFLFGKRHVSKLLYLLAFGTYCDRFRDEKDVHAWLTKDLAIREKYNADPFCNYFFTASAMGDLIRMNAACNRKEWFDAVKKDMPILLVSGAEDPVGDNGKGVTAVYESLRAAGADVQMELYENCRHEILNDTSKEDVTAKILGFIA